MDTHTFEPLTAAKTLLWEPTLWAISHESIAHRGGLLQMPSKD